MPQKLNQIQASPIVKVGVYALATVGSLRHGNPYVISYKGTRIGWVSFKTRKANSLHQNMNILKRQNYLSMSGLHLIQIIT